MLASAPVLETPELWSGLSSAAGFVILGIKHDRTTEAFPGTLGPQILLFAQSEMQNAPLAGRHRRKGIRRACLSNLIGRHSGREPQFFQARLAVAHAIEADLLVFVAGEAK